MSTQPQRPSEGRSAPPPTVASSCPLTEIRNACDVPYGATVTTGHVTAAYDAGSLCDLLPAGKLWFVQATTAGDLKSIKAVSPDELLATHTALVRPQPGCLIIARGDCSGGTDWELHCSRFPWCRADEQFDRPLAGGAE